MSLSPEFEFTDVHDLLAAVQHRYEVVEIAGKKVRLRAPTISEICRIVADHKDLLTLFDGPAPADAEAKAKADEHIVITLFRRTPRALASLAACALDKPDDSSVIDGILKTKDDFQINLAIAAYALLVREYEGVGGLFTRVLVRLDELGLEDLKRLILRLLGSTSETSNPTEKLSSSKSRKSKGFGRAAA